MDPMRYSLAKRQNRGIRVFLGVFLPDSLAGTDPTGLE